jgi:hypothetical protein
LQTVNLSSDDSCLNNGALSTSASPPAQSTSAGTSTTSSSGSSSTSTPSPSGTPGGTNSNKSGGLATGALIGIIVGAIVVVAAVVLAVFFLCRRRNRSQSRRQPSVDLLDKQAGPDHPVSQVYPYPRPTTTVYSSEGPPTSVVDYMSTRGSYNPYREAEGGSSYLPTSPQFPNPYDAASSRMSTAQQSNVGSSSMSSGQRKAAHAGVHGGSHNPLVVLHTDLEDAEEEEKEVVELPPQYSERRAPISAERLQSKSDPDRNRSVPPDADS